MGAAELSTVRALRRALHARDGHGALEALLDKVRRTPDNATFLRQVQPTVPGA
ncbi:Transcription termination factor Rho 2 [Streptomyces sp. CBMAI 2042]|nr:Transcription termination factor Rho 2 [Streptomyces sp. CBMAI 2042]